MDPCFVAPELLLWPVAKPSLSLQAPNLQAQLLERRGARKARSYTSYIHKEFGRGRGARPAKGIETAVRPPRSGAPSHRALCRTDASHPFIHLP